jgi:predicted 3-demethylubiquinone-9 3-methyltransferase (glyoxalase superfamily)
VKGITPFLWFDRQAEEAASFYVSIFPGSRVVSVSRHGDAGPGPKGTAMTVEFELAGQKFIALNGGPRFRFNESISLVVNVESQAELDRIWEGLLAGGGETQACGWLKDRYGLSWQVVPTALWKLMSGDPERSKRVMQALLAMIKLDIAALEKAAAG